MAETSQSRRARVRRPLVRAARALLAACACAALLHGALLAALSTSAAERWLRARVSAALAARLGGEVTLGHVGVDWRLRLVASRLHVPSRAQRAPALHVERARVSFSAPALLAGRAEPAAIALEGVRLSGLLAAGPLDVGAAVGPRGDRRIEATVTTPGGGRAVVAAAPAAHGWSIRAEGSGLRADDVVLDGRASRAHVASGELSFVVDAEVAADLSRVAARVRVRAERAFLAGRHLGADAIGPLAATLAAAVRWDAAGRRLSVSEGRLDLQERLPLSFEGELHAEDDLPFSLALRADGLDFGGLAAALPAALALPPSAPRPAGTLDARLDLAGPLAVPAAWKVAAKLDLARLRESGRRAPSPLREPFLHRPDPGAPGRAFVVGPANPDFVPLAELPEHVVRAVTTSEDAGFFAHAGFDFDELRNALAEGAEAGRLGRGGSTITQQLAKNLFLSPERTLARKAREAVIAVALEASLPKRRLLEIYLNVVEWGPGLWGIGPAARHWFGKDARELTPKEAAFLASVIPSPVRYHAMFERGRPSERWEARVNELLFKMTEQGALTDDELAEGLAAPISFAGG